MSSTSHFQHQRYQSGPPTSPYHLFPPVWPLDPAEAEFGEQLAQAGVNFHQAQVAALYCIHGTFGGNDFLGLFTELSRFAPRMSQALGRLGKGAIDFLLREQGNYTRQYASRLEKALAVGAGRTIPVRLFYWCSQNNHIARADGAIRLIAELARLAETLDPETPSRVVLWGHSHGGNVLALLTQLLGADQQARDDFFTAASCFYQPWLRAGVDLPVWQHVRDLLEATDPPLRKLQLDIVTFGTPVRYGWNETGCAKLLHFIHHRPPPRGAEYQAPVPLKLTHALRAADGDYIQQIGISGTNFPPLPIAPRALLADWRLNKILEREVARESIITRLRHGTRIPDTGTTLLVDYQGFKPFVLQNLAGHALYTRSQWLPFHCQQIAERFYGSSMLAAARVAAD